MSRKGILFAVGGLLVAAAGLLLLVQHRGARRLAEALARFELEIGTLDPLAHAPPDLPDAENAAFWFGKGHAALVLDDTDRAALTDFWDNDREALGPAVEAFLERNGTALGHFRHAGELRFSSWGVGYDTGPNPPMPDLLEQLWVKKVIATDARAALAAGDLKRVAADARALASLHRSLEREPLLIFQLIAGSVELSHHDLVQRILLSDLGDTELLRELAEQLDARSTGEALRAAFAVEGSWMKSTIEQSTEDAGPLWKRLRNAPARVWAPYESAAGVDLYYRVATAVELPATRIETHVYSAPKSTPVMGIIAEMLVPNLIDGLEKHRATVAARRLARLAIELRLHALEHGDYPASLEGFPGGEPSDPYAEGSVRFERSEDGTVTVSFPGADGYWQRRYSHPMRNKPIFVWRLPGGLR